MIRVEYDVCPECKHIIDDICQDERTGFCNVCKNEYTFAEMDNFEKEVVYEKDYEDFYVGVN